MAETSAIQDLIAAHRKAWEPRLKAEEELQIEAAVDVIDREESLVTMICEWPCESLADIAAKIEFAKRVFFGDDGMGATYLKIMRSMKTAAA